MTALRGTLLPQSVSGISAREIANYTTHRFTHEPDLWRIHLRTINALLISIASTTRQGDRTAKALRRSARAFSTGLLAVGVALGILVAVVTYLMLGIKPKPPIDAPVEPDPPPEGVPLDQTVAPIHYEGDTDSV